MVTRVLFGAFLLASGLGAPISEQSTTWIPNCSESELDIRWPCYEDSAKYFECLQLYQPKLIHCSDNTFFSFMHQTCVTEDQYIPAPPMESLPTEKPPVTLPTPKTPSSHPTTASSIITPVEQEPQEETTKKTTVEKTTTQSIVTTTVKPRPPTETTEKVTPPTIGPTAAATTKGVTAKPPQTTTTKNMPPIGGTSPPPETEKYPTPTHINEPHSTPPHV